MTSGDRVWKYGATGSLITVFGGTGTANGQMRAPVDIAIDPAGNVYVAELTGQRVQKFTSTGVFITRWGTPGTGDGQFQIPIGIAWDPAGFVWVADS